VSLRSPVGRALGLGAAKEGVGHWWSQRITAVALVALTLWFVTALLRLGTFEYTALIMWIGDPVTAVLLVLLIGALIYHSLLGVQVVVEDYVNGAAKVVTLLASNFLHVVLGALAIFAVLRIAFAG
jgi:succinate dehydrogenase / fumarate reductase, membrane anchor subunit